MTFQNDEAAMADAERQAEELTGRWLQWLQAWKLRFGSFSVWAGTDPHHAHGGPNGHHG